MPDLYLAWKGADDGDASVWSIRCSTALPAFDGQQQMFQSIACTSKPALAALSDRILITTAADANGGFGQELDSLQWAYCQNWPQLTVNQSVPGAASSWAPTLAPWGNGALMVWNGKDNDTRLWCSIYTQADDTWSSQFLTELESNGAPIQSGSGPALVNLFGTLLMVWRGEGDNDSLYYAWSTDGLHWSGNRQIAGAASTIAPAITVFNGQAYICFKGGKGDTNIYTSTYDPGSMSWSSVVRTGPFGTSHGPSIAAFQGMFFMSWKGADDTSVWWSQTTDPREPQDWWGQKQIDGIGSSVGPAVAVF